MKAIIKRELKNYVKNPIYWIGLFIVIIGVYQSLYTYLDIHYLDAEQELKVIEMAHRGDADVMDGYLPSSVEQIRELGLEELKRSLIEDLKMSEQEAANIIEQTEGMSIEQISIYFEEERSFFGARYAFENNEYHLGRVQEVNDYIDVKLQEHTFSYYFARKFADFGGLFMSFFSTILLASLFLRDTKRDTYELLHTKPIRAGEYVLGKVTGGFLAMLLALGVMNLVFGVLCQVHGSMVGFPVRLWDIAWATCIYILPNMLMVICVYTFVALVFKNPLPAVPLMFLYIVYSNMGSRGPDGRFGYYGRALAILVRFPGQFFDTTPPPMVLLNQVSLLAMSAVIILLAIFIWKRRRVY